LKLSAAALDGAVTALLIEPGATDLTKLDRNIGPALCRPNSTGAASPSRGLRLLNTACRASAHRMGSPTWQAIPAPSKYLGSAGLLA
jgi:hypothetical protein